MAGGQRLGLGGQLTQRLDPYLKGEATQAVKRGAYRNANAFIGQQMRVAVQLAQNMTDRKYPHAYDRDERRRPVPGADHLNDRWSYTTTQGEGPGFARLINDHPKAAMLIMGFSTDSVLTPDSFISFRTGNPVLMFPRGSDGRAFVSTGRTIQCEQPVVRPVPLSQRAVSEAESIPYRAIRQALRQGRRA